jgi:MtN3 and saliva related transmembrane protein
MCRARGNNVLSWFVAAARGARNALRLIPTDVVPLMLAEVIGWLSSAVLLATLLRQVHTQWRERSTRGVSRWLFRGQFTASCGFLIYSVMLRNWVFVVTNAALLLTALAGQLIYRRNSNRGSGPLRQPQASRDPGG